MDGVTEDSAQSDGRNCMRDNVTMDEDDVHAEYHGLTRCPFCGKEKEPTWLTCSRPSCEEEMIERMEE